MRATRASISPLTILFSLCVVLVATTSPLDIKRNKTENSMSSSSNFPKVNRILSSEPYSSHSAVCRRLTAFLQSEQQKLDAHHQRRVYWEDLFRLTQTLAETDKEKRKLELLQQQEEETSFGFASPQSMPHEKAAGFQATPPSAAAAHEQLQEETSSPSTATVKKSDHRNKQQLMNDEPETQKSRDKKARKAARKEAKKAKKAAKKRKRE